MGRYRDIQEIIWWVEKVEICRGMRHVPGEGLQYNGGGFSKVDTPKCIG